MDDLWNPWNIHWDEVDSGIKDLKSLMAKENLGFYGVTEYLIRLVKELHPEADWYLQNMKLSFHGPAFIGERTDKPLDIYAAVDLARFEQALAEVDEFETEADPSPPTLEQVAMMNPRDDLLYERLGVEKNAPVGLIKRAWKLAVMVYNPQNFPRDIMAKVTAEMAMRHVLLAKDILLDPKKREMYDNGARAAYITRNSADQRHDPEPQPAKTGSDSEDSDAGSDNEGPDSNGGLDVAPEQIASPSPPPSPCPTTRKRAVPPMPTIAESEPSPKRLKVTPFGGLRFSDTSGVFGRENPEDDEEMPDVLDPREKSAQQMIDNGFDSYAPGGGTGQKIPQNPWHMSNKKSLPKQSISTPDFYDATMKGGSRFSEPNQMVCASYPNWNIVLLAFLLSQLEQRVLLEFTVPTNRRGSVNL